MVLQHWGNKWALNITHSFQALKSFSLKTKFFGLEHILFRLIKGDPHFNIFENPIDPEGNGLFTLFSAISSVLKNKVFSNILNSTVEMRFTMPLRRRFWDPNTN